MTFLKLIHRIVIKGVRRERLLTALSVLGVALGVGLFMGVNIAATRAVQSFASTISGLDPAYNYEVVGSSGVDFREEIYRPVKTIAWKCMPLLETNAVIPSLHETAKIMGIASLSGLPYLGKATGGRVDIERFLAEPDAVVVMKSFAESHRLRTGDMIAVYVYNGAYRLRVAGVVDAPALPGNALLMDLGNFQDYFKRTGSLSRIDVHADAKQAAEIARVLPPGLVIEKKERVVESREAMVDSFRFNLRFVTFLAVLVGVFLLSNTVFISVLKRRAEIGTLRGLGMGSATVVALFSFQGLFLGCAGSVLGLVFGRLVARLSLLAVRTTIVQFTGSAGMSALAFGWKDVLVTLLGGLAVSFLASVVPAFQAARVLPYESSREGTFERSHAGRQRYFSAIGVILVLCGAGLAVAEYDAVPFRLPWLSYAGIVLFILGCTLNAPAYLGIWLRLVKRPLSLLFSPGARIAVADMRGRRFRFSLALMSVAVSSALIVATVVSVHSFRTSFVDWLDTYVAANVYIQPASCTSNFCFSPLADDIVKTVEGVPGVERVNRYRALRLEFHGQTIIAGFGNSELLWRYRPRIGAAEKERLERLSRAPEVMVSEYLAVKYGLKKGDTLSLATPRGAAAFTVNNTSISYSTLSGFIYLDRRWLKEYWGLDDATSLSVYLSPGQDAGRFIARLHQALHGEYAIDVTDNVELRQGALSVFDRSFVLTYAIELIAIVISLIGVVNALLTLVFEKKREIAVLRYLGASWRRLRQVMLLSAGIVGMAGIALGCVMGSAIGVVITRVINKISFGWEVGFRVPCSTVAVLMGVLFVTTTAAGLIPFYLVRKADPKTYISSE